MASSEHPGNLLLTLLLWQLLSNLPQQSLIGFFGGLQYYGKNTKMHLSTEEEVTPCFRSFRTLLLRSGERDGSLNPLG